MRRKGVVKGRRDYVKPGLLLLRLLLTGLLLELFHRTGEVGTAERRLRRDPIRGALPQLPLCSVVWTMRIYWRRCCYGC